MIPRKLHALGMLIPMVMLIVPNVYASESNSKRYNDGFANGSEAAAADRQQGNSFNAVCDPTGRLDSIERRQQ